MSNIGDIQALVDLFNPRKADESDDDIPPENPQKLEECEREPKINPYEKIKANRDETNSLVEDADISEIEPSTDWKKTPKWDISYRQKVTSEDVFLQMGGKTPATSSCEDMIVTIQMPGDFMQNMDIKVLEKTLTVTSPSYHLKLDLPQPVEPKKGNAKWDKDAETLTVTLRMEREFDYVNF